MVKLQYGFLSIGVSVAIALLAPLSSIKAESIILEGQTIDRGKQPLDYILSQRQEQEKRIALIIGNAEYQNAGALQNPLNDARDMAQKLTDLNFEVILVTDSSLRAMNEALETFYNQLEQGSTGLFYYAGHGIQYNGENYLIPVDANLTRASEIEYETLALGRVLATMEEAKSDVNIVILDACRDNPFARNFRSVVSRGLAPIQTSPAGLFIAFATGPGNVAEDGFGRNGTFTKAVLNNLSNENQPLETMFSQVRLEVSQETNSRQVPWTTSSLVGNFYFNADGNVSVATTNNNDYGINQRDENQVSQPRQNNPSNQSQARLGNVNRFTQSPPRLLDFSTPHNIIRHPSPTYYLTLDIPPNSFPALGKVTIEQQPGVEDIRFDLSRTEAFFGTRGDRQESIPITIRQEENSNLIEVSFDAPIGANRQVTIALKPHRNPSFAGIFQFTTHVFPVGNDTIGMNLGLGRLHFYRRN
ncbi:DUF2808 domain-containing protein [Cyanobacterium stanieri LEGE 03274]|uniref:DUF2808 domain-containing protein n=1 Tax=Cyanobacterium stanieri LEGE 03274 TaxID=1828756 RepID=A0ABR9V5L1_9CHRO|nr:DUF2808 domain-containing protein [Cyanobacterium stanieri]MBE9223185.1 DUF2808 domain-containing protein [Cyanobacterium stanieri LEGE 03274]